SDGNRALPSGDATSFVPSISLRELFARQLNLRRALGARLIRQPAVRLCLRVRRLSALLAQSQLGTEAVACVRDPWSDIPARRDSRGLRARDEHRQRPFQADEVA